MIFKQFFFNKLYRYPINAYALFYDFKIPLISCHFIFEKKKMLLIICWYSFNILSFPHFRDAPSCSRRLRALTIPWNAAELVRDTTQGWPRSTTRTTGMRTTWTCYASHNVRPVSGNMLPCAGPAEDAATVVYRVDAPVAVYTLDGGRAVSSA